VHLLVINNQLITQNARFNHKDNLLGYVTVIYYSVNCWHWNKKKVKFCLNNIVLQPTSGMRYQIPLTSQSLIGILEKLDHFHGPHKFQTSCHQILSVGMYKHPCLHIENNRFKTSARENTGVAVVTMEMLSEHRKKLSTV
jgi:hypothetical protein